jgi:hypothetical protein
MKREQALPYVSFAVDDALAERSVTDIPANARLVGWQCGPEPLFVAVWSYLPGTILDDDEAEELARDLLKERCWFVDDKNPPDADYVI